MGDFKKRKRAKGFLLGVLAFLMIFAWTSTAAIAKEPIKLGVAFALQGLWSDWCKRDLIAVDMAVEKINAAGGVSANWPRMIRSWPYWGHSPVLSAKWPFLWATG